MRAREQTFLSDLIRPEDAAIESLESRYQRVAPAVTRFARTLSKNPNLTMLVAPTPGEYRPNRTTTSDGSTAQPPVD